MKNIFDENIVKTTGMIDDNGNIFVPGVYLESGTLVDLKIKVMPGKFEIAMFPNAEDECDGDCESCPLSDECEGLYE